MTIKCIACYFIQELTSGDEFHICSNKQFNTKQEASSWLNDKTKNLRHRKDIREGIVYYTPYGVYNVVTDQKVFEKYAFTPKILSEIYNCGFFEYLFNSKK